MIVWSVWAWYDFYPTGPEDLKGIFFKKEDADKKESELQKDGMSYNNIMIYKEEVK